MLRLRTEYVMRKRSPAPTLLRDAREAPKSCAQEAVPERNRQRKKYYGSNDLGLHGIYSLPIFGGRRRLAPQTSGVFVQGSCFLLLSKGLQNAFRFFFVQAFFVLGSPMLYWVPPLFLFLL